MDDEFRFELNERDGFLEMTLYGPVTFDNVTNVLDEISESGVFKFSCRLWDLSACKLALSRDDLVALAEIGKSRDTSHGRAAIVATADLNFGLSRMHEVFREHGNLSSVKVFRDRDEAVQWLVA